MATRLNEDLWERQQAILRGAAAFVPPGSDESKERTACCAREV